MPGGKNKPTTKLSHVSWLIHRPLVRPGGWYSTYEKKDDKMLGVKKKTGRNTRHDSMCWKRSRQKANAEIVGYVGGGDCNDSPKDVRVAG